MTSPQPTLGPPPPPALLLIAPESAAGPIAEALRADLHADVQTTPSRRAALTLLRRNDFALLLIDENLASAETHAVQSIADLEKQAILATITQLHGDKLMAARLLGIGKTTLYRKLKEYGIGEDLA